MKDIQVRKAKKRKNEKKLPLMIVKLQNPEKWRQLRLEQ